MTTVNVLATTGMVQMSSRLWLVEKTSWNSRMTSYTTEVSFTPLYTVYGWADCSKEKAKRMHTRTRATAARMRTVHSNKKYKRACKLQK